MVIGSLLALVLFGHGFLGLGLLDLFGGVNPGLLGCKVIDLLGCRLRGMQLLYYVYIIIIIINAIYFYGDHVTYKGDFQRAINEAIHKHTHS